MIPNSSILSLVSDIGVLVSDGRVTQWLDQSGCGNDAIGVDESSNPPVVPNGLNGKQTIKYGGLFKVNITASDEYSFFCLVKSVDPKNADTIFLGSNNAPGVRWALGVGSSNVEGAGWAGSDGSAVLGDSSYIPPASWKLITYVKTKTQWSIFCNGIFVRSVNDISKPSYPSDYDWCLGRETLISGDYYFAGEIAQILVCEEALKNGQRKKVEREIMTYWGI